MGLSQTYLPLERHQSWNLRHLPASRLMHKIHYHRPAGFINVVFVLKGDIQGRASRKSPIIKRKEWCTLMGQFFMARKLGKLYRALEHFHISLQQNEITENSCRDNTLFQKAKLPKEDKYRNRCCWRIWVSRLYRRLPCRKKLSEQWSCKKGFRTHSEIKQYCTC